MSKRGKVSHRWRARNYRRKEVTVHVRKFLKRKWQRDGPVFVRLARASGHPAKAFERLLAFAELKQRVMRRLDLTWPYCLAQEFAHRFAPLSYDPARRTEAEMEYCIAAFDMQIGYSDAKMLHLFPRVLAMDLRNVLGGTGAVSPETREALRASTQGGRIVAKKKVAKKRKVAKADAEEKETPRETARTYTAELLIANTKEQLTDAELLEKVLAKFPDSEYTLHKVARVRYRLNKGQIARFGEEERDIQKYVDEVEEEEDEDDDEEEEDDEPKPKPKKKGKKGKKSKK